MELIKFKQFKKALTCQPYFIWHDLANAKIAEEDSHANFWNDEFVEINTTASKVIADTFGQLEKKYRAYLEKKYDTELITGSIEERIEKTKQFLDSEKILIDPAFEYDGAVSTPFAFYPKNNILINNSFSAKTKRRDFLKAYYDYSIVKKTIKVLDYQIILPMDMFAKKGEVEIFISSVAKPTKVGAYPTDDDKKLINIFDELTGKSKVLPFPEFDAVLQLIKNSEDAQISNNLIQDTTYWGDNIEWEGLLEKFNHPMYGYSGKIQNKSKLAADKKIKSSLYTTLQALQEPFINDGVVVKQFVNRIENSEKVVWYDFEGYSLPVATLDSMKPYRQTVFQISVINTIKGKEENPINKVYDPFTLNKDDLFNIIKDVYQNKASLYVVYNKAYENTRLREMVNLLEREKDSRFIEAQRMFDYIDENTLDLYDLFKVTSGNKIPPILLHDQKAKASIKNIEKHINQNNLSEDIGYKIKEYSSLDIQKGSMAMQVAIERALGIIGDNQWKLVEANLKEYCENDVKAMLMVYHFIKYLLNKKRN